MSKPVRLDSEAEEELEAAYRWYESQREGLGQEFLESVRDVLVLLEKLPSAGTPVTGVEPEIPARKLLVRRFPYSVVFLELETETRVLAVAHGRRRPGYWQRRLE